MLLYAEMETGVTQDQNGSVEENSGEIAAATTCHINQDGFSNVSFRIIFSARLFDNISSLFSMLRDQTVL